MLHINALALCFLSLCVCSQCTLLASVSRNGMRGDADKESEKNLMVSVDGASTRSRLYMGHSVRKQESQKLFDAASSNRSER